MKLNWKQIYDFWGFGLESLICWYLYKGNKRSLSFEIIKSLDYIDFIFSTTKVLVFSIISVFLMMSFYVLNPRLFLLMNAILSIIICYICFKNNWHRIGALILLCVFSFRFLIYNNSKLKEAYENSSVYVAKVQRLLPLFFLYTIAKTVTSFTLFHMLISFDFTGLRFYLFIFMNVTLYFSYEQKDYG
ncbi:hypothetical protein NBO_460g0011 [Nosema bombycis CQ1]|uniref:Uncharacterized protein n=1 Tax=Nosema bombycis (strain CQ1 / CVCC 102059) TaxID=578461 RepID=R0M2X2_NOSB1|nr:hypothetical protein NBO_460g0011 [Nosema bombycis CQ1]|eukprot:EOB12354.1 hypothetical protein NBO_460g0011 [Nosema bombycis CQ1]